MKETTMEADDENPSVAKTYTVTARHRDICHPDYVPAHHWIGVMLAGQTREEIAIEITEEWFNSNDEIPDSVTSDQCIAAVVACLKPGARFWPVDENGNEVQTTDLDDPRLQREQPYAWFTLHAESDDD